MLYKIGTNKSIVQTSVKEFVSELAVEAFNISVLPGISRHDEQSLGSDPSNPSLDSHNGELRTVVKSDRFRYSFGHEQLRQTLEHVVRPKVSSSFSAEPRYRGGAATKPCAPVLTVLPCHVLYQTLGRLTFLEYFDKSQRQETMVTGNSYRRQGLQDSTK